MRPSRRKPSDPLNARQKTLHAQQRQLQEEMERLQQLIAEAPERAKIEEKRRREELLQRARTGGPRRRESRAVLADKRYELATSYQRMNRGSLRAEKRDARLKFFALCILLVGLLIFLFSVSPF